jgi:hypothetical protein
MFISRSVKSEPNLKTGSWIKARRKTRRFTSELSGLGKDPEDSDWPERVTGDRESLKT